MKQQWLTRLGFGCLIVCCNLVQLSGQNCTIDCVWPGDLNANGVANSLDVLTLGFALGESGPPRTDQTTNWEAYVAENWSQSTTFEANLKHIDSDGDGVITEIDKDPISFNYGNMNDGFVGLLGNELLGNDLYLVPERTTVAPGDSLYVDLFLGDANNQVDSIYGIAFELAIDTQYIDLVLFDFSDTWLGSPEELITYGKFSNEADRIGIATTRIDGQAVSGNGAIGRMQIIITDVILGLELDSTACLPLSLEITNVLGVDFDETDLKVTSSVTPSVNLKHTSQLTSTNQFSEEAKLFVYPNPVNNTLYVEVGDLELDAINLWTLAGKRIDLPLPPLRSQSRISLPVASLLPGIYVLHLQFDGRRVHRKIMIR